MDYEASTLVLRKGVWYVCVTVPAELRDAFKDKQRRRSTGTSDKTAARRKQHEITAAIYAEFDTAVRTPLQTAVEDLQAAVGWETINAERWFYGYSDEEADELRRAALARLYAQRTGDEEDDLLIEQDQRHIPPLLQRFDDETRRSIRLSHLIDSYLKGRSWGRQKTMKAAESALGEFIQVVGDLPLTDVLKRHAYDYAKHLAQEGYSNSAVKTRVGYVRQYLSYLEHDGKLQRSPFTDLQLSSYGQKGSHNVPLPTAILQSLFSQDLPPHVRLCFEILITTGMRLDEVALLRKEDIKEEAGIRYFDLTAKEARLKNIGSARKVPVHDHLAIPEGDGRLFPMWKTNEDGKAQGPASKECMRYLRQVTTDSRHVVHSLRGNFKDLCRDKGVSKEMQDFITGHQSGDVAGSYGVGPSLQTRREIIHKLDHPWLGITGR